MTAPSGPPDPDAERVLSQALRAMAGGQTDSAGSAKPSVPAARTHWSTTQVVLLAVLIGLVVGMAAGIISLLV